MKEIHIEIDAPAEKVWRVLTDFAAYPEFKFRRFRGVERSPRDVDFPT